MYRQASTVAALLCGVMLGLPAQAIEVEQDNNAFTEGTDWEYNPANGAITIKTASATDTYIFWAHEDGQPTVLATIEEIKRDDNLTSGTIKVKVSKSGGPGATNLGKITFDTANITSIIEGIDITGNLFSVAASTVDHVTGPIEVGGSLLKAMTVLEDLEGAVTIADFTTVGADIEIVGDVLEPISIGTYIEHRDEDSYNGITPVAAPITVYGNLVAPIYVYGNLGAALQIDGDMIGANTNFRGVTRPMGLWVFGDLNADVTIEGEKYADIIIEGDLSADKKLHMKGLSTLRTHVNDCYNDEDEIGCFDEAKGLKGTIEVGTDAASADLGATGQSGTIYVNGDIWEGGLVAIHGSVESGNVTCAVMHPTASLIVGAVGENGNIGASEMERDQADEATILVNGDVAAGARIQVNQMGGHIAVAGNILSGALVQVISLTGTIEVEGNAESSATTFPFWVQEIADGTLTVKSASVVNGAPLVDDAVILSMFTFNQTPVPPRFEAQQPAFYDSPTTPFGGDGPADSDYTFHISVTGRSDFGPLSASIVLNDPGEPTGQFDLRVPMNLTTLALAPELQEDPYTYLHNLYVAGSVNAGAEEFAIDVPNAPLNSIYIGGVLGSEDNEEFFDRIRVDSIGTLAFGSLGSEDLHVPEDGVSGSGTPVILADEFLRSNDFIQSFGGLNQPTAFFYSHEDSAGSPAGFTRSFQGAATYVSFYHRNPSDECILDSCAGPASWCCAKGPITDIDNSGFVHLVDFQTFAVCFGKTEPDQDCPCDVFAHCDLNLDGSIGLLDFNTFAVAFVPAGDGVRDGDCCSSPPCEEGEADLEFIQEFLEETIEPLISGDNDWVESIQALTAEIAAFEPEEEYEGIVAALDAINFKPVAQDKAYTVTKNTPKIMTLGAATDPDNDTLLVDLVTTDPAHGSYGWAYYDLDGNLISFQYIPDTDYTGEDVLTWRASEVGTSQQYYDEAVITITVTE